MTTKYITSLGFSGLFVLLVGTVTVAETPKANTSKTVKPFYTTSEFIGTIWVDKWGSEFRISAGGKYTKIFSRDQMQEDKEGTWTLNGNTFSYVESGWTMKAKIINKNYMFFKTEDGSTWEARLKK